MTFTIEQAERQSAWRVDHVQIMVDSVMDQLPEGATQAQIDDLISQWIVGDLRGPKTLKTVRNHFIRYWPLIQPLAHREPELFDMILLEFAEITTVLD